MNETIVGLISAFWLGILTSISPCPLATNIASISFLSSKISSHKTIFLSGLSYTIGRMLTYAVLGFVIIHSLIRVPTAANFLQRYMNKALGPILVIVGLFLLDVFKFNIPAFSISQKKQDNLARSGIKGSLALGILFALSFCPVSAALFFGSLIPLSLKYKFGIALPFIYGIGTGFPVFIFALLIALSVKSIGLWYKKITDFEIYARKATAIIFILVGIYYILTHIF